MSYCRFENTSRALQDCVDALWDSDLQDNLSTYEVHGLEKIQELSQEIVDMYDKIENILENQKELENGY